MVAAQSLRFQATVEVPFQVYSAIVFSSAESNKLDIPWVERCTAQLCVLRPKTVLPRYQRPLRAGYEVVTGQLHARTLELPEVEESLIEAESKHARYEGRSEEGNDG
jgi:hypothetical protein